MGYLKVALGLRNKFGKGIALMSNLSDLPNLPSWCRSHDVSPNEVDLIVTVGDVSQHDPVSYAKYVRQTLISELGSSPSWRRTYLNSHSAARDHGGFPKGRSLCPRKCWLVWVAVITPQLPFDLHYSDCGHVHPSLDEVPGYAMANATVSVRYAIDNNWVVIKGSPTGGPSGSPMRTQYQSHAQALLREAEFNQIPDCWGDDRIRHYATTTGGTGGRQQWVEVLLNRHMSHVCERLP